MTLRRTLPPGQPIAPEYLDLFQRVRARVEWQLSMPRGAAGAKANDH